MNTWELLSLILVSSVVGLSSGPVAALKKSIWSCRFEVFVEMVDRMNWTVPPALTVLLPCSFLSLCLSAVAAYGTFSNHFLLDMAALVFFLAALLVAVVLEIPVVREIATWSASLWVPPNWQGVRKRWLRIHLVRIALGLAGLIVLCVACGLELLKALKR